MKLPNLFVPRHPFAITVQILQGVETALVTVTAVRAALLLLELTCEQRDGQIKNAAAAPVLRFTAHQLRCLLRSHQAKNFTAVGPVWKLNLPRSPLFWRADFI